MMCVAHRLNLLVRIAEARRGATTTTTGLSVIAELDEGSYPIGIKISDRQMKDLPISRDDWHGDWNYTLHPTRDTPETH